MDQGLNEKSFILFAAKHYDNPQCFDKQEFIDDLKRFKYLKRLFNQYLKGGDIKERHILNHIIALKNMFGPEPTTKMLFYKLEGYEPQLKPFLVLLNIMPGTIVTPTKTIKDSEIPLDAVIVNKLRTI